MLGRMGTPRKIPLTLLPTPVCRGPRPHTPSEKTATVDFRAVRWQQFELQFSGDPRIQEPVMYALPTRLIEQLRQRAPNLLNAEDLKFETQLRELGGTGFCQGRAFASEVLDPFYTADLPVDLYGEFFPTIFRRGQFGMHDAIGGNKVKNERREVLRKSLLRQLAERHRGYAAWLVTNSAFRDEAARVQRTWEEWPQLSSHLPTLEALSKYPRLSAAGMSQVARLYQQAKQLLERWNLTGFDTWDLPVPVSPVFLTDDHIPKNALKSMGTSLFLPWSTPLGQEIQLEAVIEYHRGRHELAHLDQWLRPRDDQWGPVRSAKLMQLYVYLELAIKRRYGDRLRDQLGTVDKVFRSFWHEEEGRETEASVKADAEKRIRLELKKRLNAIGAPANA